jgi:long-chain acyl-CoA synthetase
MTADVWGHRVVRRDTGIPFLVYEPRPRSVVQLLAESKRWAGRDYLVQGERRVTYQSLLDAVESGAGQLSRAGIEPGQRVLLLAANSPDWIIGFWSIVRAGATVVLGNGWWSSDEVTHAVRVASPALVLADARCGDRVPPDLRLLPVEDLAAGAGPAPATPEGLEDDPAVILFTSGSTGAPKGAVLSHRAIIALQHSLLQITRRLPSAANEDTPGQVTLQTGPLFHIGGVQAMLRTLLTGGTMVFLRGRFDPAEVISLIEGEKVHRWGGVPTMVARVLDYPGVDGRDLSTVRALTLGGTHVPVSLMERIRQHFPNATAGLSQIYGLSEAGGTLTAASGNDSLTRPGTAGRPLPIVEVRIDDADDAGVGEVLARSPAQMSGYWGQPDDDTIDPDGWLHTGDLGRFDDDGYLYIVGRSKDLIIRGGENIASAHVEATLLDHPAVAEVAVIGLPDEDLGEVVGAAVVLKPGPEVKTEELRDFAMSRLAHFEVPTRWWLRDTLPVNAAGKPDKVAIKAGWVEQAQ